MLRKEIRFVDIPQNFGEQGSKWGCNKQISEILCGKEFFCESMLTMFCTWKSMKLSYCIARIELTKQRVVSSRRLQPVEVGLKNWGNSTNKYLDKKDWQVYYLVGLANNKHALFVCSNYLLLIYLQKKRWIARSWIRERRKFSTP